MPTEVLLEVVRQVPALAVLVWLAWSQSTERRQMAKLFAGSVRDMANECHRHQERGTLALLESAKALQRMAGAVGDCPVRPQSLKPQDGG